MIPPVFNERLAKYEIPRPGTWRSVARGVICRAYADGWRQGLDPDGIARLIDERYPFGERDHYPYSVWLDERKQARVILGLDPESDRLRRRRCGPTYHPPDNQLPLIPRDKEGL